MTNKKIQKDILLVACTHGDEQIGLKAIKKLKKYAKYFDWIIANPRACSRQVRFIDCDLNRCAPGNLKSKIYEEKRAAQILKIAGNYKLVIDLHGSTSKKCGFFIILTNTEIKSLILAGNLNVDKIVVWCTNKNKKTGPWTRFVIPSVEVECGDKMNKETVLKLVEILSGFFEDYKDNRFDDNYRKKLAGKQVFSVIGDLRGKDVFGKYQDFKITRYQGKTFYPLLSGQYGGQMCYTMEKVTDPAKENGDFMINTLKSRRKIREKAKKKCVRILPRKLDKF